METHCNSLPLRLELCAKRKESSTYRTNLVIPSSDPRKLLRCPPFNLKYFLLALTAFVPAALWSAGKKYAAAWSQITDAREEQKRSRYEQSTLLIKDFKYGPSLSIFVLKK